MGQKDARASLHPKSISSYRTNSPEAVAGSFRPLALKKWCLRPMKRPRTNSSSAYICVPLVHNVETLIAQLNHSATCSQCLNIEPNPSDEGRAAMLRQGRYLSFDDATECRCCAPDEADHRWWKQSFFSSSTSFRRTDDDHLGWFFGHSRQGPLCFGSRIFFKLVERPDIQLAGKRGRPKGPRKLWVNVSRIETVEPMRWSWLAPG